MQQLTAMEDYSDCLCERWLNPSGFHGKAHRQHSPATVCGAAVHPNASRFTLMSGEDVEGEALLESFLKELVHRPRPRASSLLQRFC